MEQPTPNIGGTMKHTINVRHKYYKKREHQQKLRERIQKYEEEIKIINRKLDDLRMFIHKDDELVD